MIWLLTIGAEALKSSCPECTLGSRGNGHCDLLCMSESCGFDSKADSPLGDCYTACLALGCAELSVHNGVCEAECDVLECGWDGGDCGYCAQGCNSYTGFASMLGDGTCNRECLTPPCSYDFGDCSFEMCSDGCHSSMLGNGECDSPCRVAACQWDSADCDCAPGCSQRLLLNALCDAPCNVANCGFDAGQCGRSMESVCASGCDPSMVGNHVCDEACYNAACGWDGLDCGCAANCRVSEYGSCKAECLVPDCNYDGMLNFANCGSETRRTAALYYHLSAGNFSLPFAAENCASSCSIASWEQSTAACVEGCFTSACGLSSANCAGSCDSQPLHCADCGLEGSHGCVKCAGGLYHFFRACVPTCPAHFRPHHLVTSLCYPDTDSTQVDSPAVFYVASGASADGRGTAEDPFDSLAMALAACVFRFCRVVLQPGTYQLTLRTPSSFLHTWDQYADLKPLLANTTRLELTTCSDCQRPLLLFDNLFPLQLTVPGVVVISNIDMSGQSPLVAGCATEKCAYCGSVSVAPSGVGTDDQGSTLAAGTFAPASACTRFKYYSLFVLLPGASLTVRNSTIAGFRQGFGSLFTMKSGDLTLENVVFTNVSTANSVGFSSQYGVIQQNTTSFVPGPLVVVSSYEPGSIQVLNSTVSLLNNGYEMVSGAAQSGFLTSSAIKVIRIVNSTFTLSVVQNGSLLNASAFLQLLIDGCAFSYIHTETALLQLRVTGVLSLADSQTDYYLDHIVLRNCSFSRVGAVPRSATALGASGMLLSLSISGQPLNVVLQNLTFYKCMAASLLSLSRTGSNITDAEKFGGTATYTSGSQTLTVAVPFMWLRLRQILVDRTFVSGNLVVISRLNNVEIQGVDIESSADSMGVATVNSQILTHIIGKPGVYMKKQLTASALASCSAPVSFQTVYNITMTESIFNNVTCLKTTTSTSSTIVGQAGLVGSALSGPFNLSKSSFTVVSGPSVGGGTLLYISTAGPVLLYRLTVDSVSNTGGTSILFFTVTAAVDVSIAQCAFQHLSSLGAVVSISGGYSLTVASSSFSLNRGSSLIYFLPGSNFTAASVAVTDSEFSGNAGNDGAVLYLTNIVLAPVPVLLAVARSQFLGNAATGSGTALYIDSKTALAPGSAVVDCRFHANVVKEGLLFIAHLSGDLTVRGSTFSNNTAKSTSILSASLQPNSTAAVPTFVKIASSDFRYNSGTAMAKVSNPNGFDLIYSENNTFVSNYMPLFDIERTNLVDSFSVFQDNRGQAFYGKSQSVINSTSSAFTRCNSTQGGAVYLGGNSELNCLLCNFTDNFAVTNGGAVYVEQASVVTARNCSFLRNRSGGRGSAAYLFGSLANSTFRYSTFLENDSGDSGTIVAISSAVRIRQCDLARNTAAKHVGVTAYFSFVSITLSTVREHRRLSSPFIYSALESNLVITSSVFSGLQTTSSGGVIYALSSTLSVTSSEFRDIQAVDGVLLLASTGTLFSFTDCTVAGVNSTDEYGGVLTLSSSAGNLTNTTFRDFQRGGVVGSDLQYLRLSGVSFLSKPHTDGSAETGGGVSCASCQVVSFAQCTFKGLSATKGAAVYLSGHARHSQSDPAVFSDCRFQDLLSIEGGLYLENIDADFTRCSFQHCSAVLPIGHGGAMSLWCPDRPAGCSVVLDTCTFVDNSADDEGGSVKWYHSMPVVRSTTFEGGTAWYGPDFASFPVTLHVSSVQGNVTMNATSEYEAVLLAVASGQTTEQTVVVTLYDHYGQHVKVDSESTATILGNDSSTSVFGTTSAQGVNGTYILQGFGVTAEPGTDAFLRVVTSAIDFSMKDAARDNVTYSATVLLKAEMRACRIGESYFQSQCAVCPQGKYSLNPLKNCEDCSPNAICYGNYTMVPKSGYWRSSPYTDEFWKCPYESACIGSPEPPQALSLTGDCQIGYFGNLCNACVSGFSRMSQVECGRCPSLAVNIVRTAGIALALLVSLVVIVATAIRSAYKSASHFSIFIKILLNYLQLVMLTASFDLRWPSYMLELFRTQQTVGNVTDQVFSIDCFFDSDNGESQTNAVRLKIVILSFLPVLMICLGGVFWLPYSIVTRRWELLKNELVTTSVVFFFLIHPSLVKFMFDFLNCRQLDPGEYWMSSYLNIRCWDNVHMYYSLIVALPSISVWGIGLPFVCLGYLIKNRRKLSLTTMRLRLGFIYNGYVMHHYYWEFVILYRKIVIISIAVFIANVSVYIQALSAMLVIIFAFALQSKNKPYIVPAMNELELRAILVSGVTIYSGMYCMSDSLDFTSLFVLFILIVSLNAYFLSYWAMKMLAASWQILKSRFGWLARLCSRRSYRVQNLRNTRITSAISAFSEAKHAHSPDVSQLQDDSEVHGSSLAAPDNSALPCEATSRRYHDDGSPARL